MTRAFAVWGLLAVAVALPVALAANSPLLQWRTPVYIAAGLAGVVAMAQLLVQPLLVAGAMPGMRGLRGRRMHRLAGIALIAALFLHVGGLWVTSPPDVIDALLLRSPTPFSAFGVIAFWALFAAALVAGLRRKLRLRPLPWRLAHVGLVATAVAGSVIHALLIIGTMEFLSKALLCGLVVVATAAAIVRTGPPRR